MKIAILTQPLRYNYGGIIQNFALQTVLKRMGHIVVTLDPKRYAYPRWKHLFVILRKATVKYIKRQSEVYILGEYLQDKSIRLLGTNTFKFIDKYIKRREYTDLQKEVKETDYDAFIVGSDQVWRPEYNTNLSDMFLVFTKDWNVRRIAYAASFGVDYWNCGAEMTEKCKQLLKRFDFVSVRESTGVMLCKNIFEVDAVHLLDPTMLLTKEEYYSSLHLDRVPKSNGNLLVYILDYSEDKNKLVQLIAEKKHLIPFRVNSEVENSMADLDKRIQPPIEQWVRGFYDAEYVITDSFHACVFSIIFDKPFIVYSNDSRGKARFESLLNQFSLNDCILSSSEEFHGFSHYKKETDQLLSALREQSYRILKDKLL